MVEGAHFGASRNDPAEHGIHVLEQVSSGDAHDPKVLALEQCVTREVAARLIAKRMPFAVHLDNDSMAEAGEVYGHFADRKLFPELQSPRSLPQLLPKQHFG
jgi:hypothetical protein